MLVLQQNLWSALKELYYAECDLLEFELIIRLKNYRFNITQQNECTFHYTKLKIYYKYTHYIKITEILYIVLIVVRTASSGLYIRQQVTFRLDEIRFIVQFLTIME